MKKLTWILFAFFAIGIGLYPLLYFLVDMTQGFLSSKSNEQLNSSTWYFFFYQHIIFGGIALLTGWSQFSKKIRNRNLGFHRNLGKVYIIACILSGIAGLYIAYFATGGWIAPLGFGGLGTLWLITTIKAYLSIRKGNTNDHENWMTRSYALTFAAVMLRVWLPLSQIAQIEFITAYLIISWLCWVPNLMVAELIIVKRSR